MENLHHVGVKVQGLFKRRMPASRCSPDKIEACNFFSSEDEVWGSVRDGETAYRGLFGGQPIDVGPLSLWMASILSTALAAGLESMCIDGWSGASWCCEPVLCAGSGNPCDSTVSVMCLS